MSRTEFIDETRAALRALAVPFESRELLDCNVMWATPDPAGAAGGN
jgi:hypothetical protein